MSKIIYHFYSVKSIQCEHNANIQIIRMAPKLAPTVKLNNGYEMPILGLGTYLVSEL